MILQIHINNKNNKLFGKSRLKSAVSLQSYGLVRREPCVCDLQLVDKLNTNTEMQEMINDYNMVSACSLHFRDVCHCRCFKCEKKKNSKELKYAVWSPAGESAE